MARASAPGNKKSSADRRSRYSLLRQSDCFVISRDMPGVDHMTANLNAQIFRRQFSADRSSVVGRCVVYNHDAYVPVGLIQYTVDALPQVTRVIIARNNDVNPAHRRMPREQLLRRAVYPLRTLGL